MKETQFLGSILLESPLMFDILEKVRGKYSIDKLDISKEPYKQNVRQWPYPPFGHPPQMQTTRWARKIGK
jgi:hypothetical protein